MIAAAQIYDGVNIVWTDCENEFVADESEKRLRQQNEVLQTIKYNPQRSMYLKRYRDMVMMIWWKY